MEQNIALESEQLEVKASPLYRIAQTLASGVMSLGLWVCIYEHGENATMNSVIQYVEL